MSLLQGMFFLATELRSYGENRSSAPKKTKIEIKKDGIMFYAIFFI
jgi:hypothetical protein